MTVGGPEPAIAAFFAERYWPGLDESTARRAARRLADQAAGEGDRATITVLACTFVPGEQSILVLVCAESREDVAEIGQRADLAFDRIAAAVILPIGSLADGPQGAASGPVCDTTQ